MKAVTTQRQKYKRDISEAVKGLSQAEWVMRQTFMMTWSKPTLHGWWLAVRPAVVNIILASLELEKLRLMLDEEVLLSQHKAAIVDGEIYLRVKDNEQHE